MASQDYYNAGDEWMQDYKKDPYRLMKRRAMVRNVAPKIYSGAEKAYNRMNPEEQKLMRRKLQNLQKKSPNLAKALAEKKPSALVGLAKNLRRQVDLGHDWLFILLFSFGLLKDIFDIAFAALGAIPVVGIAGTAIGIIVSFVGNLMFLILTVTVLILVGSSIKNRGPAKYFVGTAMEFIAEALPGISWLPWTPVYVLVLYLFVLYDRAHQDQRAQSASINIPSSGAADNYYEDKRLAA
ncbi:MAG: hypothetical protein WC726_04515 [Parcubacteria group bacterium]|jgi:hypothetical protein